MDVKDIRIFKAVYETGSISKASQGVYMTTQGVSKVVQKMESELGTVLFTRSNKGVLPTASADKLYQQAGKLIDILNDITEQDADKAATIPLRVAFSYGILSYIGYDFLDKFTSEHSNIALTYSEETDYAMETMLRQSSLDIAIIGLPTDITDYDCTPLFSCRHVAVINVSNPLSGKKALCYRDLDGQAIALVGHQFNPYHHNMLRLYKHQVRPASVTEMSEIINTHLFASQNKGIGISVDFVARAQPLFPDTVVLPFSEEDCTWDTCILSLKEHQPNAAAAAFRDELLAYRKSLML